MKFTGLSSLLSVALSNDRCSPVDFAPAGTFPLTSLSSYPGSGNTWVRFLIEEYTGYYTGSIYSDKNLFKGGFKGEQEDWKTGQMIVIKAHSFRDERELRDAVLLIRNPFDAILAEFNRLKGGAKGGDHHTGVATLDDFLSDDWVDMDIGKRAFRWYKLYNGNLLTRRTLPIFYEDLKQYPIPEMEKIGAFLNITDTNSAEKFDCLFGDHSKKFKRSSDREYDPYNFMGKEKFDAVNMYVRKLNETLLQVHGITLPDDYIRQPEENY